MQQKNTHAAIKLCSPKRRRNNQVGQVVRQSDKKNRGDQQKHIYEREYHYGGVQSQLKIENTNSVYHYQQIGDNKNRLNHLNSIPIYEGTNHASSVPLYERHNNVSRVPIHERVDHVSSPLYETQYIIDANHSLPGQINFKIRSSRHSPRIDFQGTFENSKNILRQSQTKVIQKVGKADNQQYRYFQGQNQVRYKYEHKHLIYQGQGHLQQQNKRLPERSPQKNNQKIVLGASPGSQIKYRYSQNRERNGKDYKSIREPPVQNRSANDKDSAGTTHSKNQKNGLLGFCPSWLWWLLLLLVILALLVILILALTGVLFPKQHTKPKYLTMEFVDIIETKGKPVTLQNVQKYDNEIQKELFFDHPQAPLAKQLPINLVFTELKSSLTQYQSKVGQIISKNQIKQEIQEKAENSNSNANQSTNKSGNSTSISSEVQNRQSQYQKNSKKLSQAVDQSKISQQKLKELKKKKGQSQQIEQKGQQLQQNGILSVESAKRQQQQTLKVFKADAKDLQFQANNLFISVKELSQRAQVAKQQVEQFKAQIADFGASATGLIQNAQKLAKDDVATQEQQKYKNEAEIQQFTGKFRENVKSFEMELENVAKEMEGQSLVNSSPQVVVKPVEVKSQIEEKLAEVQKKIDLALAKVEKIDEQGKKVGKDKQNSTNEQLGSAIQSIKFSQSTIVQKLQKQLKEDQKRAKTLQNKINAEMDAQVNQNKEVQSLKGDIQSLSTDLIGLVGIASTIKTASSQLEGNIKTQQNGIQTDIQELGTQLTQAIQKSEKRMQVVTEKVEAIESTEKEVLETQISSLKESTLAALASAKAIREQVQSKKGNDDSIIVKQLQELQERVSSSIVQAEDITVTLQNSVRKKQNEQLEDLKNQIESLISNTDKIVDDLKQVEQQQQNEVIRTSQNEIQDQVKETTVSLEQSKDNFIKSAKETLAEKGSEMLRNGAQMTSVQDSLQQQAEEQLKNIKKLSNELVSSLQDTEKQGQKEKQKINEQKQKLQEKKLKKLQTGIVATAAILSAAKGSQLLQKETIVEDQKNQAQVKQSLQQVQSEGWKIIQQTKKIEKKMVDKSENDVNQQLQDKKKELMLTQSSLSELVQTAQKKAINLSENELTEANEIKDQIKSVQRKIDEDISRLNLSKGIAVTSVQQNQNELLQEEQGALTQISKQMDKTVKLAQQINQEVIGLNRQQQEKQIGQLADSIGNLEAQVNSLTQDDKKIFDQGLKQTQKQKSNKISRNEIQEIQGSLRSAYKSLSKYQSELVKDNQDQFNLKAKVEQLKGTIKRIRYNLINYNWHYEQGARQQNSRQTIQKLANNKAKKLRLHHLI